MDCAVLGCDRVASLPQLPIDSRRGFRQLDLKVEPRKPTVLYLSMVIDVVSINKRSAATGSCDGRFRAAPKHYNSHVARRCRTAGSQRDRKMTYRYGEKPLPNLFERHIVRSTHRVVDGSAQEAGASLPRSAAVPFRRVNSVPTFVLRALADQTGRRGGTR